MRLWKLVASVLLVPSVCLAQAQDSGGAAELSPPPLVNADAPRPQGAGMDQGAPTPPPPGSSVPPATTGYGTTPYGTYRPQAQGYPAYSPYGVPYGQAQMPKPGPEVGLMVSETLFGALTSAGTALLPYYLLLKPLASDPSNVTLTNILTIVLFGAVPLAVSETIVGIANGSSYYRVDGWPAALTGLGFEGATLGLAYLTASGGGSASELILLIGTIGVVPLAEMAITNLVKVPRNRMMGMGPMGAALSYTPEHGLQASLPMPQPLFTNLGGAVLAGLSLPLLQGRF